VPEVVELAVYATPGRRVDKFEHGGNTIGYVIFDVNVDVDADAEYRRIVQKIFAALKIEVTADE